tara:strand:+ start:209 stop:460 length:252 start_codon:yes stop_codon:yes gene_type:complete
MITKPEYIKFKEMYDYRRKIEYNKEKIKKRIDKMYEEFEFNIIETKEEVFEHFWENVNLNRTKLDEPPVEWKPQNRKLRLWNE